LEAVKKKYLVPLQPMDFHHSICTEDREEQDGSEISQLDSENMQDYSGPDMATDTMEESDSEDENDDSEEENDDEEMYQSEESKRALRHV
jgi:hypothetical protein